MLLLVNSALQTRHLIGQKAANFYLNCYTIIKVAEWFPVYVLWTLQLVKQSLAGCGFPVNSHARVSNNIIHMVAPVCIYVCTYL